MFTPFKMFDPESGQRRARQAIEMGRRVSEWQTGQLELSHRHAQAWFSSAWDHTLACSRAASDLALGLGGAMADIAAPVTEA